MLNKNFGSFALPAGYDYNVKTFTRQVKTRTWASKYKKELVKYHDRLTRANRDDRQIIGGMLQAAFGANIGRQVEDGLADQDLEKIRKNIIFII